MQAQRGTSVGLHCLEVNVALMPCALQLHLETVASSSRRLRMWQLVPVVLWVPAQLLSFGEQPQVHMQYKNYLSICRFQIQWMLVWCLCVQQRTSCQREDLYHGLWILLDIMKKVNSCELYITTDCLIVCLKIQNHSQLQGQAGCGQVIRLNIRCGCLGSMVSQLLLFYHWCNLTSTIIQTSLCSPLDICLVTPYLQE